MIEQDADCFVLVCLLICLACRSVLSVCLSVCPSILVWLQAMGWLHKRGRSYSDLKTDNIRILMGQKPGTFCHVTLLDVGGSVKFRGERLIGIAFLMYWMHMAAFCFVLL